MLVLIMETVAILGSHPNLSIAEIVAVLGRNPKKIHKDIALFDGDYEDAGPLMKRLGGTQKLGVVVGCVDSWNENELAAFLAADLIAEHAEGKISYGLSVYDYGAGQARVDDIRKASGPLGLTLKHKLKNEGRGARFVISKEPTLSSVVVTKNRLIEKGAEYMLLVDEGQVTIAKTTAVQDFEDWSARDFDRPRRNAKQGMLPPKLARMMVNFVGKAPHVSVYDPFCGSGTILMEAAMLGVPTLVGSDISGGAVFDTKQNLEWLTKRGVNVGEPNLFTAKATDVLKHLAPGSVDSIVTETYLGMPRKGNESRDDILRAIEYIGHLYEESFAALRDVLKDGGTVVVASPVHFLGDEHVVPDVKSIFEKLGFAEVSLGDEPLVYRREGQLVGRQFFRFRKK